MSDGRILHLQRLSTEDGPGIRTTVFFKGCPLRCAWCHNPESLSPRPQTQWFAARCLGCRTCVEACPNECITLNGDGQVVERARCQGCFTCVEACPANAIEALGQVVSVPELVSELLKDRVYYEKSGGGVTLSGGEPTLQATFVGELLGALQAEGIATALDTCGMCTPQTLERLLPAADLVLFDIKLIDPAAHRQHTGQTNERILENLLSIQEHMQAEGRPAALWIRTPLIPGATASEDNLRGIGRFLSEHLAGFVTRWELCAFNNLCREQYTRLGMTWAYAEQPLMTAEALAHWEATARAAVDDPAIVVASGATRV